MKKCQYCYKFPHSTIKSAIKYQVNVNLYKIKKDIPFTVYECPYCDKYLVSLKAAKERILQMEFPDVSWSDEIGQELEGDFQQADAGQGWHRIGKTDISLTRFIKWSSGQPTEVSFEEWKKLPVGQRGHDFLFKVDIAEFDQRAKDEGWTYERRVTFKGRDWWQILVPSFEEVFGKKSMGAKQYMATLNKVKGQYVDWMDVSQAPDKNGNVPTNQNTGKPYTTCKLFKVFANKEEAQIAYDALGVGSSNGSNHYPSSWSSDGNTPESIIEYGRTILDKDDAALAEELFLTADGLPANTSDGKPVDIAAILAEIRDVPKEMVNPLK